MVKLRLSDFVPPVVLRTLRRSQPLPQNQQHWLTEGFPNWAAAVASAGSSNFKTDLAYYSEVTQKVRRREAPSSRNVGAVLAGMLFAKGCNILDFGGCLGSVYFEILNIDPALVSSWRIVDLPAVVEHGNKTFADDKLSFFTAIETACEGFKPDIILSLGCLQYLEHPYDLLTALLHHRPEALVLDGLPVSNRSQFLVQHYPSFMGGGSWPAQVLSDSKLAKATAAYQMVFEDIRSPWDPKLDARLVSQVYRKIEGRNHSISQP